MLVATEAAMLGEELIKVEPMEVHWRQLVPTQETC